MVLRNRAILLITSHRVPFFSRNYYDDIADPMLEAVTPTAEMSGFYVYMRVVESRNIWGDEEKNFTFLHILVGNCPFVRDLY